MKIIQKIVCSKCGKKQISGVEELLHENLFWRVCEFCKCYGLTLITKQRLTVREWMEAFYNSMGLQLIQEEAFLKKELKNRRRP